MVNYFQSIVFTDQLCVLIVFFFHWIHEEKDNSHRSSGRGCMDVAPAMRSTTSDCVTASSLESIMAKASHMRPFMLTRSELTCKLKHLYWMLKS